jgi:murein tripeptide amidase MpaA
MRHLSALLVIVALVLSSCATRSVTFDSSMETGNGHQFTEIAPGVFTFEIENDTNSTDRQWFMFDVLGARGQTLTLQLLDTELTNVTNHWDTARPVYSRDGGRTWNHVEGPFDHDNAIYTFSHRFGSDRERIAFHFPYTYSMLLDKVEEWKASPYTTHAVLGQSIEGRDLHFFRVTDEPIGNDMRKRGIWVIGRQHGAEVTGSFSTEGFMDFVLSEAPEAQALRRHAVINIVPMVNPDGNAAGNYRDNVAGVNLNRVWDGRASLDDSPEVVHVQSAIDAWAAQGRPYDLFLDFHSTSGPGPHFAFHPNQSRKPAKYHDPEQYHADSRRLLELVNKYCAHFSPTRGASGSTSQLLAYHRQREQHGVLAYTPEGTYNQVSLGPNADVYQTPETHRQVGVGFAKAIVDFFGME